MSYRIGVFGGMFDPVHNGHVEAARLAKSSLKLDKLKMIPCHIPNHRGSAFAPVEARLQMLELAVADLSGIEVDSIEIDRKSTSYTIDTLSLLHELNPAASLVLVLGADSFNSLPTWHRWLDLFGLCHFMVFARPGWELAEKLSSEIEVSSRQVESPQAMFEQSSGKIFMQKDFAFDISSTAVRESLIIGGDVASLLGEDVKNYITENNLYR